MQITPELRETINASIASFVESLTEHILQKSSAETTEQQNVVNEEACCAVQMPDPGQKPPRYIPLEVYVRPADVAKVFEYIDTLDDPYTFIVGDRQIPLAKDDYAALVDWSNDVNERAREAIKVLRSEIE